MQFRRRGQPDQRRRRVLMEEMLAGSATGEDEPGVSAGAGTATAAASALRRYSDAALAAHQPPVTSLIPKRAATLIILFLVGLVGIAATLALYTSIFLRAAAPLRAVLTGLDVTARGSIAAWYAALLLLLATFSSVMVYLLRRHRRDDYRGRYRVWLWTAFALLTASFDAVTGLHAAVEQLPIGPGRPLGGAAIWPLAALWAIYGLLGLRLLFEMYRARFALTFLLAATGGYATATAAKADMLFSGSALLKNMASCSSATLGHLCVLCGVVAYCRFVYHEAQGEIPQRKAKRRIARKDPGRPAKGRSEIERSPSAGPGTEQQQRKRSRKVRVDDSHDRSAEGGEASSMQEGGEDPPPGSDRPPDVEAEAPAHGRKKPSKAERRRARKQARKQGGNA